MNTAAHFRSAVPFLAMMALAACAPKPQSGTQLSAAKTSESGNEPSAPGSVYAAVYMDPDVPTLDAEFAGKFAIVDNCLVIAADGSGDTFTVVLPSTADVGGLSVSPPTFSVDGAAIELGKTYMMGGAPGGLNGALREPIPAHCPAATIAVDNINA